MTVDIWQSGQFRSHAGNMEPTVAKAKLEESTAYQNSLRFCPHQDSPGEVYTRYQDSRHLNRIAGQVLLNYCLKELSQLQPGEELLPDQFICILQPLIEFSDHRCLMYGRYPNEGTQINPLENSKFEHEGEESYSASLSEILTKLRIIFETAERNPEEVRQSYDDLSAGLQLVRDRMVEVEDDGTINFTFLRPKTRLHFEQLDQDDLFISTESEDSKLRKFTDCPAAQTVRRFKTKFFRYFKVINTEKGLMLVRTDYHFP